MSLSERVRPNVECAPWVIGEIVALEEENGVLRQRIEASTHRFLDRKSTRLNSSH